MSATTSLHGQIDLIVRSADAYVIHRPNTNGVKFEMAADRPTRMVFLCIKGLDHFTGDLIAGLNNSPDLDVRKVLVTNNDVYKKAVAWADVVWFEFWLPPFPKLANATDFGKRDVYIRMHGFEVKSTKTPARIPYEKVRRIFVVSNSLFDLAKESFPIKEDAFVVLYNGIDRSRFEKYATTSKQKKVGILGNLYPHKNPMLSLHVFQAFHKMNPEYTLSFAYMNADKTVQRYLEFVSEASGIDGSLSFDGYVAKPEEWLSDKEFLLHGSIHETYGFAIGEAALAGVKPVVANYPGASEFWPEEILYSTVDEAVHVMLDYPTVALRSCVRNIVSISQQVHQVEKVISKREA